MKISFSTLGCPTWVWTDIVAMTSDLGYDGLEIRGVASEMYAPNAGPFLPVNIKKTMDNLRRKGLEISCLSSSAYLYRKNDTERYLKEGIDYISLADKLDVPYVRVLADEQPYPGDNIDIQFTARNIKELADYAEEKNVIVLVETNGIFAESKKMLELLDKVDRPNVGVVWDIHHPFRFMGEAVEDTYNALKQYIKHVHVKDSVMAEKNIRYRMAGHGDVPIREAVNLLKRDGYEGYVSLEWTKRWNPDLEEPAIAFPHFVHYIKEIIEDE